MAQSLPSRVFVGPVGGYSDVLRLDPRFDSRLEISGSVRAVVALPDGRYYVAGSFLRINGAPRTSIARFLADRSIDNGFAVRSGGIAGDVYAVAVQPDGKLVIGGSFTRVGDVARSRIARLNNDGSLDMSFDPEYGCDGIVRGLAVDAEGRIIACGDFGYFGGFRRWGLVRITSGGQIDFSFFPYAPTLSGYVGKGFDGGAKCLALQSDGRIVIGGSFDSYNGIARKHLARLNADGTLDTTFDPGGAVGLTVEALVLQSDGRVLVGGSGWALPNYLLRLNGDGALDSGFGGGAGLDGAVSALAIDSSGRIMVGGAFAMCGGTSRKRLARLTSDGTLDRSFEPGEGADNVIGAVAHTIGGDVLIGGAFERFDSHSAQAVARISTDGAFVSGAQGACRMPERIDRLEPTEGARWLADGSFRWAGDSPVERRVRLLADGAVDSSFAPPPVEGWPQNCRAIQPDGKLLVGYVSPVGTVIRYNLDGSVDSTFSVGSGFNAGVNSMVVQPDGRIVVGGAFTSCNTIGCSRIIRLNPDGSLDASFKPGLGFDDSVKTLAVQPDGRIVVGGFFLRHDGRWRVSISRINSDGSFDPSFDPGDGFSSPVTDMKVQNDGRIVVAGDFDYFDRSSCGKVVRLNADGSRDTGFQVSGLQIVYPVAIPRIAYTDDGRLLVTGVYASAGESYRGGLVMFTGSRLVSFGEWIAPRSISADQKAPLCALTEDGVPNLLKFAMGVSPQENAGAHVPTASMCDLGDGCEVLALSFAKNREAIGLRFALEASENLVDWGEVPALTETLSENADGTLSVRMSEVIPAQSCHRFLRLKVSAAGQ